MTTTLMQGRRKSPNPNIWYDLIQAPAGKVLVVRELRLSNTAGSSGAFHMQLTDSGGTNLATLWDGIAVAAHGRLVEYGRFIVMIDQQKLQVKTNVTGSHFLEFGGYE
jgi:hypothetical protein